MTKNYPIDFCLFAENAPDHLCITGAKYKKSGAGYVTMSERESLSTTLSKKYNLSIAIIRAILQAYPKENPDKAVELHGPSPALHSLYHWGQKRYRAMKLMKPSWEIGSLKLYSQEEYERCRAIVELEDSKKKQARENFNRKTQLKNRKRIKDGIK